MNYENYESLKPEEQEELFHHSPFKERGDLLLRAHDPVKLTRSLSHEELYLVTREMDLDDKSEVLKYASLPQLCFISDLDCWKADRVDKDGFIDWLETLLRADEVKLVAWMLSMDPSVIAAGFKKLMQVMKPEREYAVDELLGDRPYFTLDQMYFIFCSDENMETVKRVLELLYEAHRGRYIALLEEVLWEIEDQTEEDAYLNRETRLAERGFPDTETAHKIYRPLTLAELENYKREDFKEDRNAAIKPPQYLALWGQEKLFFDEAVLLLREDEKLSEQLQEELAWLCNKVLACNGIDFSSEERIRRGIERARSLLSLGLELLSGGNLEKAAGFLRRYWLESIFRYGMGPLLALREETLKVIRIYWKADSKPFLLFLNPPYEFMFQGFLRVVPEWFDASRPEGDSWRDFKTTQELKTADRAVSQIMKTHQFIDAQSPSFFKKSPAGPAPFERTLYAVLGNLFAAYALKKKPSSGPVSLATVKAFLQKAFKPSGSRLSLDPEVKESFLQAFFSSEEQSLLRPLWGFVFQGIEEELGKVNAENLDPRFISALYAAGEKSKPEAVKKKRK